MTRVDGLQLRRNSDGSIALRVSEPGYDLNSTPVDDQMLRFSSDWPATMPLWYSSPVLRVNKGATVTQAYPSALTYIPFVTYMFKKPGASGWSFSATSDIRGAFTDSAGALRLLGQSSYAYVDVFFNVYRLKAF